METIPTLRLRLIFVGIENGIQDKTNVESSNVRERWLNRLKPVKSVLQFNLVPRKVQSCTQSPLHLFYFTDGGDTNFPERYQNLKSTN